MLPSDTTMRTLWLRMAEFYGHKWTSAYGDGFDESGSAGTTWQKGMVGVTGENIATGLKSCLLRTDPWPPTLPEFRSLCVPLRTHQPEPWKSSKPDPSKMPGPKRLAWHVANIAHIKVGGGLPRDVPEPKVWE